MIKRSLGLGAVLTCLVAGTAVAADMPMKAAPYNHRAAACAQFGGFYLGAQAGGVNYSNSFNDLDQFGHNEIDSDLGNNVSQTGRGGLAGVQTGYNWQSGCTVFGIETDWAWTSAKASSTFSDGQGFPPETTDHITPTSKLRWFGTLRTRTGVVVDNLLLYVTGGLAYANIRRDALFFEDNDPPGPETFSTSRTRFGWTAGAGTEWAINANWSLKSEFLYMQFGKDEKTFTSQIISGGQQFRLKNEDSAWVGRIGLNYRFGY
jgi:outer membrane immunogenic protein